MCIRDRSNTQSVQAKAEVKQQSESELKHYYNKPIFEYKKAVSYTHLTLPTTPYV
ncbi:hypothetical protein JMUB7552_27360 [Staphylococcus aureus]